MSASASKDAPLSGYVVVDATRLLPGAVLARTLIDLGARVIKVESSSGGDPMRALPPFVAGVGAGFVAFYRGAESILLDLATEEGARGLRKLARHADVVLESFRPGTMERWGVGPATLRAANPRLVVCSLSSFGRSGSWAGRVGHDLNFSGLAGLLSYLPSKEMPGVQPADIVSAVLASSAVVAALLRRERTGVGATIDQPLASGPLPLLTWAWADASAGPGGIQGTLLAGACPCYRMYSCGDGKRLALGALEPKFWTGFVELLGLRHLAGAGLATGEPARRAVDEIEAALAKKPRATWLELAVAAQLPVTPVHETEEAMEEPYFREAGLVEQTPAPGGATLHTPGPFIPSLGKTPDRPAPALGEHDAALRREFSL